MATERERPDIDPVRDPRLAHVLRQEFGVSATEVAYRVAGIMSAVAQRATDVRTWWNVVAAWSRAVVPIGVALAAAALLLMLRAPSDVMTRVPTSYPDVESRNITVVEIIATRTTSHDVVASYMPPSADELLEAAVRR